MHLFEGYFIVNSLEEVLSILSETNFENLQNIEFKFFLLVLSGTTMCLKIRSSLSLVYT